MKHNFILDVSTIFIAFSLLLSNFAIAGDCGSKKGRLNQVAMTFVIPDYFPPNSVLLKNLVSIPLGLNNCKRFGKADLTPGCSAHDTCYKKHVGRKKQKKHKKLCDAKLLQNWKSSCKSKYRNRYKKNLIRKVAYIDNSARSTCRMACVQFVSLMSEAQTVKKPGFCPSCDAFAAAQK